MDRRTFLGTLAGTLLAAPLAAEAQQAGKIAKLGWLSPESGTPRPTFREALRELGYIEGQTIALEVRGARNNLDRLPELARELVRSKVNVIVAVSAPAIQAAALATSAIPIIMAFGGSGLRESGLLTSMARPGSNVTGVYMFASELDGKRLELLLEAVPKARKVAVLNPRPGAPFREVEQVAQAARVQLYLTEVPGPDGYERVFESIGKARADAVLVPASPRFFQDAQRIVQLAAKHRVPSMYEWAQISRGGGLIAYGPDLTDLDRRVAAFVDAVLKGRSPGDLPVEQATKFELVINLKTAKALGLTIPPSLLQRADQVIE